MATQDSLKKRVDQTRKTNKSAQIHYDALKKLKEFCKKNHLKSSEYWELWFSHVNGHHGLNF